MENYVIIVAGGKGLRMGTDIPKQFLPIGGLPVLMHTIKTFKNYDNNMNVILVLPEHQQEYWRELCNKYSFDENIEIANGGETRFHSVKNGLALIPDETKGVVGVHDGVRPFVSEETIHRRKQERRVLQFLLFLSLTHLDIFSNRRSRMTRTKRTKKRYKRLMKRFTLKQYKEMNTVLCKLPKLLIYSY